MKGKATAAPRSRLDNNPKGEDEQICMITCSARKEKRMRGIIILTFLLLLPGAVFADALATCVAVFDAETYRVVTSSNDVARVAEGDLFSKSVFQTYFSSKGQGKDEVVADFAWQNKQYRLLIRRLERKTIYTILLVSADKPPQVEAVGEIQHVPVSKEIKDDPKADSFVVVVRTGNYLSH
jgi:hypothetical protein